MLGGVKCRLGYHHWIQQRVEEQTIGECTRCKKRDYEHFGDGMPISGPWRTSAGQVSPY